MRRMKRIYSYILVSCLMLCLTGCGSGGYSDAGSTATVSDSYTNGLSLSDSASVSSSYKSASAEGDYSPTESVMMTDEVPESVTQETQNIDQITLLEEKLVYRCNMEIETLEYTNTMASVKAAVQKYGGVIQSESESDDSYHWYYDDYVKTEGTMRNYINLRIPTENYEAFLNEIGGVGRVVSKSTSVDNISQRYYDTETQIEALEIQEDNLLKMMEQCYTIEEMITVQERLSEVQYQLDSLKTNKRYMDVDVAYSYVNLTVIEVMEYHYGDAPIKTNKFIDRLGNTLKATGKGFLNFLEGLLFLIIRLFPYLVILGIILLCLKNKIKAFMQDKKRERAATKAQKEMRQNAILQQQQQFKAAQNNQNIQNNQKN